MAKKRKQQLAVEEEDDDRRESKRRDTESAEEGGGEEMEAKHPWRNLQLILSLQNKDIPIQKKVELALNFVKQREEGAGEYEDLETVNILRVILFLNNWVQSLLISSEKKLRVENYKPAHEIIGSVLDFRCWDILKYCLEEALRRNVSLTFSKDFLRVVQYIATSASSRVNVVSQESNETILIVTHCVSLIFSAHGGVLNENIDLWILNVNAVLDLMQRILDQNLEGSKAGVLGMKLACTVLEPFAKFLRIHPNKKNGFRDFVDKLLEPLLHLLDSLQAPPHDSNPGSAHSLVRFVEESLSHGLFHPSHMEGLLSLQSTRKYMKLENGKPMDTSISVQSYHRHLFDKLDKICLGKDVVALNGLGNLLHLFANCVKRQTGASSRGGLGNLQNELPGNASKSSSENNKANAEENDISANLNGETRKSLFDFFVLIMEPLLQRLKHYLVVGLELGPDLVNFLSVLSSANKVIATFSNEKLYLRTEDISEGASFNFLKLLYDTMLSLCAKITQVWVLANDQAKTTENEKLNAIAGNLLSVIGNLVEIEYEVVGDDLESLWFVIYSFGALGLSLPCAHDQHSVTRQTLHLGRQLVNLYCELRQVNTVLFTLCKVMRCLILPEGVRLQNSLKLSSGEAVLNSRACVESVSTVLCSQDVRLAIFHAVVSIPEGQVNGLIRQLTTDISESLEWIKDDKSFSSENDSAAECPSTDKLHADTRAELLGRGLCDVYALVLDSLSLTVGNSNLIRVSIEEMVKVLGRSMKSLVAIQQDSVTEFLSAVTGRTHRDCSLEYTQWILMYFFRLYMSCRSLYRQAMSLVPIDTSGKMSAGMGDPITAYSGKDWLERSDWNLGGYFSWIANNPSSLVTMIQSISDIYLVTNAASCCAPLVYTLNAMATQRLVDVNRLIKSFEYLLQRNGYLGQNNKLSDDIPSSNSKSLKRSRKYISSLRQEAADLTKFILGHLTLLAEKPMCISSSGDAIHKGSDVHPQPGCYSWQFDVSAVNDKSLPIALWWMICQSIDVWCRHASKKKVKLFLSILIENSTLCDNISFNDFALPGSTKDSHLVKTFASNRSCELLWDTVLYEQKFLCRHIASSFCQILEKSVLAVCNDGGEVGLNSSPNWIEFLKLLERSSKSSGMNVDFDNSTSVMNSVSGLSVKQSKEGCDAQGSSFLHNVVFRDCFVLLNLLCWMPKGYLSSKSFSLYATCIINVEKLVLGNIMDSLDSVSGKNFAMLSRLFLSCRRVLKNLIMEYFEEKRESHSFAALMFSQSSAPVLWLLKSISAAGVSFQAHSSDSDSDTRTKDMVFSLMDHTSYVFLTLSKYQLIHESNTLIDSKLPTESTIYVEVLNNIVLVAETLTEQMNAIFSQRKAHFDGLDVLELNNLSAVLSCSQGFWHGFAAALDQIDSGTCNIKKEVSRSKHKIMAKLRRSVDELAEFVNYYLCALFVEDHKYGDQTRSFSEMSVDVPLREKASFKDPEDVTTKREQHDFGILKNCSMSTDRKDQSDKRLRKKSLQSQNADSWNNIFSECDSFDVSHIKKSLLLGLVRGENPEAAFFLRQLFLAASVLLRLNSQIYFAPKFLSSVPILVGISQILLVEMGGRGELSSSVSLVWLDGLTKFLEELANHLPLTDPILSSNVYVKLVELQFVAIGKCITLQGKSAYLASHDTESSTKTLDEKMELSDSSLSCGTYYLDEFKARLRRSLQAFLEKPSEMHLHAAIEALQRALVGLEVGSRTHYDVCIGSSDGGKVSSKVAGGIDCMDLVLEFVTGRKHLTVVKTHIQGLTSCLFNTILHLQASPIFVTNIRPDKGSAEPDSGSVILMCVEVLSRVCGKHSIYHLNSVQVGQSLRIPGALFQNIFQLRHSKDIDLPNYPRLVDIQDAKNIEGTHCNMDRRFSIDLFAACCRLLGTVIKHYKSETERCVSLLENSVSTLLHCLEMVNTAQMVEKKSFAWELEEAVKCAAFLRRIYEELRQQKDVFGRHCSLFLSSYIWTYTGYGPLKIGILREVDNALRPGVYALIDACSADDLQRLHTVFGEGPCRSTLANLQHDYKFNFQYEGKV